VTETHAIAPSATGDAIGAMKMKAFSVSLDDGVRMGSFQADQLISELASWKNLPYIGAGMVFLSLVVLAGLLRQYVLGVMGALAGFSVMGAAKYPILCGAALGVILITGLGYLLFSLWDRYRNGKTAEQLVTGVQAVRNKLKAGEAIANLQEFDDIISGLITAPVAAKTISRLKSKAKAKAAKSHDKTAAKQVW
jgi:hypothetical protein